MKFYFSQTKGSLQDVQIMLVELYLLQQWIFGGICQEPTERLQFELKIGLRLYLFIE